MARTLSDFKSLLNSKLDQSSVSMSASSLDRTVRLALDAMLMRMSFREQMRTRPLSPFFNDVTKYSCPADLKGDGIVSYRRYPSGDRQVRTVLANDGTGFDSQGWFPADGRFAVEYDGNARILRMDVPSGGQDILLHGCDSYDGDGTWEAVLDGTNVRTDTGNYVQGSGSVAFDIDVSIAAANSATIRVTDMAAKDVSGADSGSYYVFVDAYLPTAAITSVRFRWGNDTSNYYESTVTANHDGTAFVAGWNTLGFSRSTATETGSVDDSDIRYLCHRVNYGASMTDQTGFRLDNVWLREGGLWEVRYVSKYAVLSSAGSAKQNFTADDDTLVCDEDGEAVFADWLAGYAAPNVKEDGRTWMQAAESSMASYRRRFPDPRTPLTRTYMTT